MNCPVDNSVLTMSERSGIEIDFCPQCRGVWLDRGELDKIIERASNVNPPQSVSQPVSYDQPRYESPKKQQYYTDDDYRHGYSKKKRKESFLGDLFDF